MKVVKLQNEFEQVIIERWKVSLKCKYANVQSHSGSQMN